MSVVTLLLAMPTTVSAVTKEKFVGTTYRINVKGNFKWTSSNKKIAVVDQRKKTVKALKIQAAHSRDFSRELAAFKDHFFRKISYKNQLLFKKNNILKV